MTERENKEPTLQEKAIEVLTFALLLLLQAIFGKLYSTAVRSMPKIGTLAAKATPLKDARVLAPEVYGATVGVDTVDVPLAAVATLVDHGA